MRAVFFVLAAGLLCSFGHALPARLLFDQPYSNTSALEVAIEAAAWLEETAVCRHIAGVRECHWAMNSTDDAPKNYPYIAKTLYYGSGGPAIFLAQLSAATKGEVSEKALSLAAAALHNILVELPLIVHSFGDNTGFYYGLAGVAFSLRTVAPHLRHPLPYVAAAEHLEDLILSKAPFSENEAAPLWNNTDIAHGASGTGLYLLWASQHAVHVHAQRLRDAAFRGGKWLMGRAEKTEAGLRWMRGPDTDGEHAGQYFPTFCCGTAGVSFFLAELYHASVLLGDRRPELLAAAQAGAAHVMSLAVVRDGTLLVPHTEGETPPLYYLAWCHGPPGYTRLFARLWQLSADGHGDADDNAKWVTAITQGAQAVRHVALPQFSWLAPIDKAVGPWDNLGQCCGAAAGGTLFLRVAEARLPFTAETKAAALESAIATAEKIYSRALFLGDAAAFPSPELHAHPSDRTIEPGWMQGAAGIGSFYLHLHAVLSGPDTPGRRPRWPDEPQW